MFGKNKDKKSKKSKKEEVVVENTEVVEDAPVNKTEDAPVNKTEDAPEVSETVSEKPTRRIPTGIKKLYARLNPESGAAKKLARKYGL